MRPSPGVVERVVKTWDQPVEWSARERSELSRALLKISLANGGRIFEDVPLNRRTYDWYFYSTVDTAISREMRRRARALDRVPDIPYRIVPADHLKPTWPMVGGRRPAARIDVNRASARKLAGLEELSFEQAKAIVQYRKAHGPFADLQPLTELVGKAVARRLGYQVFAGRPGQQWPGLSRHQRHFIRFPTFKSYLKLLIAEGELQPEEACVKARILRELTAIERSLRDSPDPRFPPGRVISASEVVRLKEIDRFADRLNRGASRDLRGATLLDNYQYLRFVSDGLAKASTSIRVVMFFMFRGEGDRQPIDPLLTELVKAARRGVDVRVILDKDEEGDVFHSRHINRNAFRFLVSEGIQVAFSTVNKVIHSKLVLIDDRHVIVGSHNWTSGSFFRYDDKSLYIESEQFARLVRRKFERLWLRSEKRSLVRDRLLSELAPNLKSLSSHGIASVEDFLLMTNSEEKRKDLSRKAGLAGRDLDAARISLLLADFKGRLEPVHRSLPRRVRAVDKALARSAQESTVFTMAVGDGGRGRTLFFLLNEDGHATAYPCRLAPGAEGKVRVCIENQESAASRYLVRIGRESGLDKEFLVSVRPGERVERDYTFGVVAGAGRQDVYFRLYKELRPGVLYGALKLAVGMVEEDP